MRTIDFIDRHQEPRVPFRVKEDSVSNRNGPSAHVPPDVVDDLRLNYLRIRELVSAQRLWDSVLTSSERVALGNDLLQAYAQFGTVGMWTRLFGVSDVRAIIDVARALNLIDVPTQRRLLSRTGEFSEDHEEALQQALENADLVLTDRPRAAYWMGRPIPIDWDRQSALWHFFWELCVRAKTRSSVDHTDFPGDREPSYPAKIKSRLVNMPDFPLKLADLIEPSGRSAQRLCLAPDRIRLFKTEIRELCREELGRANA